VLSTCPICKRPVKPDLTDRTLYCILENANGPVGNFRAYSCGAKGHIIIVAEDGNGLSRPTESSQGTNVVASPRILNGWKEIAAYIGRGVRTVQRWESHVGLPVHRPQGRDRSAVVAFAEELDAWLLHTPVRLLADTSTGMGAPKMPPGATHTDLPMRKAPSGVR
jgi:hypothetical protein